MNTPADRIADALERIATMLETGAHINIDHGHIEHYAFLRRIQKEKKQLDIKNKIIEKTGFEEVMNVEPGALTGAMSEYNTIKDNIAQKKNR